MASKLLKSFINCCELLVNECAVPGRPSPSTFQTLHRTVNLKVLTLLLDKNFDNKVKNMFGNGQLPYCGLLQNHKPF